MTVQFNSPFSSYFGTKNTGAKRMLVGGEIEFTQSGSDKAVIVKRDESGKFNSRNPAPLTGASRADVWLDNGSYRTRLTDSKGAQIAYFDPYILNPADSTADANFSLTGSYSINEVVKSTDSLLYVSLINDNIGLLPQDNPSAWSRYRLFRVWNTDESYSVGAIAQDVGILYISLTANNQGNVPASTDNWRILDKSSGLVKSGILEIPDSMGSEQIFPVGGLGFEPKSLQIRVLGSQDVAPSSLFFDQLSFPNLGTISLLTNTTGIGSSVRDITAGSTSVFDTPETQASIWEFAIGTGVAGIIIGGELLLDQFGVNGFTLRALPQGDDDVINPMQLMWTARDYGVGLDVG